MPAVAARVLAAVLVLALLAACGGDGGDPDGDARGDAPAAAPDEPGVEHVHGLGIDPGDDALLVATHNGLFRLGREGGDLERVGDALHDLMGFTVVGPGHYLASGHPDARAMEEEGLPPNLGLMETRDGGVTWTNVSLLGEADFHVLRARGETLYGFDATNRRLLASRDGGAGWDERDAPGLLFDLAIDPGDVTRLVATGEEGLLESRDGGRSWQRLGDRVGFLAWPVGGPLHLVDPDGIVWSSRDAGEWRRVGGAGGPPGAFLAAGPRDLYVALHDGEIRRSSDGGTTWTVPAGG